MPMPSKPSALSLVTGMASMATGLANAQVPPLTPLTFSASVSTAATIPPALPTPTHVPVVSKPKTQILTTTVVTNPIANRTSVRKPVVTPQLTIDKPKETSVVQSRTYSKDNMFDTKRTQESAVDQQKNRKSSDGSLDNNGSPKEPTRSASQLSGESSGDESRSDGSRRGRRRSIVRQQSYEEEVDGQGQQSLLTLWGAGGALPLRRHSAQGPARREEALEAARKGRDSLDVPTRSQRHHSCDYDLPNSSLLVAR